MKSFLTEILKIKGDWQEVVDDCRATVGKKELGKEPSKRFKIGLLIAEHTPIRDISIKWRWKDMPHWITVHWVRHKWEKFVCTQRDDRTGIPRDKLPQDEPQTFKGEANTQHLIDTMRRRLCRKAHEKTRAYAEDLKDAIFDGGEQEISGVLVPNCVYRCGCPEMECCGMWHRFVRWCIERKGVDVRTLSIRARYEYFNDWRINSGEYEHA